VRIAAALGMRRQDAIAGLMPAKKLRLLRDLIRVG
jgi:hypothetical protein